MLQVQFTISVTPLVFRKTFSGCKTYARAPVSSQEPGELVDDTSSVTMDRDDIVKVFGVVSALSAQHCHSRKCFGSGSCKQWASYTCDVHVAHRDRYWHACLGGQQHHCVRDVK